jgi:hypothetical protein
MGREGTKNRDEVALERLETLVRALEEEARALGTLHLLEQFKRELPAPVGSGPPLETAPREALVGGARPRSEPPPAQRLPRPRRHR